MYPVGYVVNMGLSKKDLTVDDHGIIIDHSLVSLNIPFSEIEDAILVDGASFNLGHVVSGEKTDRRYIGKYVNSAFGIYTMYSYADVDRYIVVTYGGGKTLVFNMPTASATEATAQKMGAVSE